MRKRSKPRLHLDAGTAVRVLIRFNIRDYMALAEQYPQHAGILLAAQRSWTLPGTAVANRRLTTRKWAKANFIEVSIEANMLEYVS